MRARYVTAKEKEHIGPCLNCRGKDEYDGWHIRVVRDGGKLDFVICAVCGGLLAKIGQNIDVEKDPWVKVKQDEDS